MMTRSPLKHSRTSRTKKSMLELPIPMLIIDIGIPLYRPVNVKKPRSEDKTSGFGDASRRMATALAREGDPTVSYQLLR